MIKTEKFRARLMSAVRGQRSMLLMCDWLRIGDIIRPEFSDLRLLPKERHAEEKCILLTVRLSPAAVRNADFDPLEYVGIRLSRALSYYRRQQQEPEYRVEPHPIMFISYDSNEKVIRVRTYIRVDKNDFEKAAAAAERVITNSAADITAAARAVAKVRKEAAR